MIEVRFTETEAVSSQDVLTYSASRYISADIFWELYTVIRLRQAGIPVQWEQPTQVKVLAGKLICFTDMKTLDIVYQWSNNDQ